MPAAGPSDSWDDPSAEPRPFVPVVRRDEPVPDDWDVDDDDDEDDPAKIWENENNKVPMPQVVIASSSTSSSTVPPPAAAFQPSIRILKRPSASSNCQPVTPPAADAQQKSFVQREADYQLARERIFGGSSTRAETTATLVAKRDTTGSQALRDTPGCQPSRKVTPPATKIIRNPRGPDTSKGSQSGPAKGFKSRRPQESETQPSS